jgi:Na+-transporting methylmalonyl-CoA/oxaloacetate decarboxylase beta subunit
MESKKLSEFTDQELLAEAKKIKTTAIIDAVLIGFLVGVVFYSIVNKSFGILMLIPIYLGYKLINKPKHHKKDVEALLKERNLK